MQRRERSKREEKKKKRKKEQDALSLPPSLRTLRLSRLCVDQSTPQKIDID